MIVCHDKEGFRWWTLYFCRFVLSRSRTLGPSRAKPGDQVWHSKYKGELPHVSQCKLSLQSYTWICLSALVEMSITDSLCVTCGYFACMQRNVTLLHCRCRMLRVANHLWSGSNVSLLFLESIVPISTGDPLSQAVAPHWSWNMFNISLMGRKAQFHPHVWEILEVHGNSDQSELRLSGWRG